MKTTREMVSVNVEQARYYDDIQRVESERRGVGYAETQSANLFTRAWAALRYRQQAAVRASGVEQRVRDAVTRWVESRRGGDILELGCFSGSPHTWIMVGAAGRYLGIDLSPLAVDALKRELAARGLAAKADAVAADFLEFDAGRQFDVIYSHGVLHHFENPAILFERLAVLVKPGGILVFVEPSAVNPVYRCLRALYRPFQSDRAWEWPFSAVTVAELERRFRVVEGFGWGRFSLPLSVLTGLPVVGRWLLPRYLGVVRSEADAAWHRRVWHNSYVAAVCERRGDASPGSSPN